MKRQFNIFDGLFLLALVFKLKNWTPTPTWFEVFLPYVIESVLSLIKVLSQLFGWEDRVKFWFWNWAKDRAVKRAGTKARDYMKAQEEAGKARSGNPGRFTDPQNLGK